MRIFAKTMLCIFVVLLGISIESVIVKEFADSYGRHIASFMLGGLIGASCSLIAKLK